MSAAPHADSSLLPLAAIAAAFAWSFAEATVFFIVADVLLTFIAVAMGLRVALLASLAAAIGAACGGMIMWRHGLADPVAATNLLAAVPFVSSGMIAKGMTSMASVQISGMATIAVPLAGSGRLSHVLASCLVTMRPGGVF